MRYRIIIALMMLMCIVVCSCARDAASEPSAEPPETAEQVIETEPGYVTASEMVERFEDCLHTNAEPLLTEGQMLPYEEVGEEFCGPLIEKTVFEKQELISAVKYASGDVVMFFEPLTPEQLADVENSEEQLAEKGYAYADCIPEDAHHCIVVLSDDADRGALVKETYYKIPTGMPL